MKDNLYVIAQSLQQPRVVKRIIQKAGEYKSVKVYGFKRDFFDVGNINLLNDHSNIEVCIVGALRNEKYLARLFLYFRLFYLLNFKTPGGRKEIYIFGLDLRFICCFLYNVKIHYEIADIMWLYKKGFSRKLLSTIDYYLTKWSDKVIFTSEGFYRYYYTFLPESKVLIIENKFKTYGKVQPLQSIVTDKLRVAYVGSFRYSKIIADLVKIFNRNQQWELNFYGDGFENDIRQIKSAADSNANIHYFGAFNNPTDLQSIYAQNNLNFVAYDNELDNERVAMPNKYYESGFFNIPIVCSQNTFVGEKTVELQMGWVVDPDEKSIEEFLNKITIRDLVESHERIKKLDKSLFEYS